MLLGANAVCCGGWVHMFESIEFVVYLFLGLLGFGNFSVNY